MSSFVADNADNADNEGKAVELTIGGMTCASCANRIERQLNKLDGVTATVNYATEKGEGHLPGTRRPAATDRRGGEGRLHGGAARPTKGGRRSGGGHHELRDRLITSIVLSVPVVAMAMIPPLQFTYWQWLTLAAPVVAYAGWPFHRAAWTNLR